MGPPWGERILTRRGSDTRALTLPCEATARRRPCASQEDQNMTTLAPWSQTCGFQNPEKQFFFFVKPSSLWHFVTATHSPTWQRGSTNNSHSLLPRFLAINLARNIQNLAKKFKMPPMIWEGLNGNTIFSLGYIQHVDLSKLCESNDKFRLILVKSKWNFFWVFDKMILKYAWKKNKTCYRKKEEQWHLLNIKTHCIGRIIQIILYS